MSISVERGRNFFVFQVEFLLNNRFLEASVPFVGITQVSIFRQIIGKFANKLCGVS